MRPPGGRRAPGARGRVFYWGRPCGRKAAAGPPLPPDGGTWKGNPDANRGLPEGNHKNPGPVRGRGPGVRLGGGAVRPAVRRGDGGRDEQCRRAQAGGRPPGDVLRAPGRNRFDGQPHRGGRQPAPGPGRRGGPAHPARAKGHGLRRPGAARGRGREAAPPAHGGRPEKELSARGAVRGRRLPAGQGARAGAGGRPGAAGTPPHRPAERPRLRQDLRRPRLRGRDLPRAEDAAGPAARGGPLLRRLLAGGGRRPSRWSRTSPWRWTSATRKPPARPRAKR